MSFKRNNITKLLTALLLVSLIAFLAACNTGGEADTTDNDPGQNVTDPTNGNGDEVVQTSFTPGLAAPQFATRAEIVANRDAVTPSGQIIFGSATQSDPNIMAGWTNIATNNHARILMFEGLGTAVSNPDREFFPNPMVMVGGNYPEIRDNADGSRTYTFEIYTDNRFSDGTFVTAYHYVGNIAFHLSPQWRLLVPSLTMFPELYGRLAFIDGDTNYLAGLRVYNDSTFSVTVGADFLPFVWEVASFMNMHPFPIHALGVAVHDSENGVYLTNLEGGTLTADAVALAVNGGAPQFALDEYDEPTDTIIGGDGFRFAPSVTVGPYRFGSFDSSTFQITLHTNPYFVGTWDGFLPRIETVIIRHTPQGQLIDALAGGEIDMVVGQGGGETINGMINGAVANGTHTFERYMRNGYGLIQFHVDHGATGFRSVRQAIKWLIDREEFAEMFTHGHGVVNHAPYGSAQWFAMEAYERGMLEQLILYTYNPARAIQILEADGWIYNAAGEPFVSLDESSDSMANAGANNFRHKRLDDGTLMSLDIYWCTFVENAITDVIDTLLPGPMSYVGMNLIDYRTPIALQHMTRSINGIDNPEHGMFNLGLSHAVIWSPWFVYSPDFPGTHNWAFSSWDNPEHVAVFEAAERLRFMEVVTDAGRSEFVDAFMDLMILLNYEVFIIPLYVDIWFDFFPTNLGD